MGRKKSKPKGHRTPSNKADNSNDRDEEISYSNSKETQILVEESESRLGTSSETEKSAVDTHMDGTDIEILFENNRLNTERVVGREYFIHSLCQVCKEELYNRVLCPKCKLVNYCSDNHRKQHWNVHKDLCKAITELCTDRQTDHIMEGSLNCSAEEFRIFRFRNMVECEAKVGRSLDRWEREIFIFPNVCGICHQYDSKTLDICSSCKHSGFCKDHRTNDHNKWCEFLLRYKNIIRDQSKFGIVCPSVPRTKLSKVLPKLQDMKQLFKVFLNYKNTYEYFELAEITTYPLTTLNALLDMKTDRQRTKVTIHVIGAEADFEINQPKKWEYFILHLIPELKNLEIEFIGPELRPTPEQKTITVCSKCKEAKKSMNLKFHRDLYHLFSKKPKFSKPHLICVFNPGLYRTTGFNNEDTWSPTIESMFDQDCPVLTTAYTHKEVHLDVQRVKQTQTISLVGEPMLNPFSSLKPSLNLVSDEESPVIFKNHYYCIMCKA
ncbi:uncharacterized protein LOC128997927 [Macrosteles quadrilineatus]|uniref:uncharacterized protein LOC128997927 n=1 Tax=Macrosteles quadrilineatus TaxID=74068 RepID=UPI0023E2B8DB|nr:uncharacterized protein LOC128997927 [Macrosteles quadrilineatus]